MYCNHRIAVTVYTLTTKITNNNNNNNNNQTDRTIPNNKADIIRDNEKRTCMLTL